MSANGDESSSADRRWLIGIAISVFFGLFGVVMALLAYSDRTKAPAPAPSPSVTSTPPQLTAAPAKASVAPAATPEPTVTAEPVDPAATESPLTGGKKKQHK